MSEFMKVSCLKKLRHEDVGMVVNMIKTNQFEIKNERYVYNWGHIMRS